ncbi:helix-turn-helix domain-containing protein [Gloeocapsopsis sp. IPPAS B-1203]|uniref:helix-turn-helix domain-containing protein n=1 Tax=Gloeocapsopsis sp. IPPAS B-1203 TaxID=2049454 RepID=UPI000C186989|nr:helix-turn-helix domain-containing protein [Gloeocapsopsis sp. IPPAS B-1203]PIG91312.1 DNA-binding protein [Gloeocapsopsis sp. IPPAS B-1203]
MRQKRQEQGEHRGENEQFLTTNEIAEILRVHQRTVQRWISSNRLKATKVGPKILRVRRQDLNEFLESQNQDHQEQSLDGYRDTK